MDPVTNTLAGAALATAFFRRRAGALSALLLGANLPDVDALVLFTGDPAALTVRRSFGHSVLALPVLALVLALLLKAKHPERGLRFLFGLSLLGASVHVLLDLLTSSGVLLLWPLAGWRPELDILFVMDAVLILVLAAPLLLCLPRWQGIERSSKRALACAAAYILLCAASRKIAALRLAGEAKTFQAEASFVFPEPYGAHRWRGVLKRGNLYRVYLMNSLSGRVELKSELASQLDDPLVAAVRKSPSARWVEPFFKAPVWSAKSGEARVYDLRFRPLVTDEGLLFSWVFKVGPDGRVGRAGWAGPASSVMDGAAPPSAEDGGGPN